MPLRVFIYDLLLSAGLHAVLEVRKGLYLAQKMELRHHPCWGDLSLPLISSGMHERN